jgi:ABC-type transporter Mla maintaining outer membrane lipid asymmetry ATPase subunit MlaF/ABC-type transporter Mla maintaining outer membrane lipid asymmetry permease subunit MlaE
MLSISGLDFGYGSSLLFDGLELNLAAGEHVVIVGDSGGGKSTLLSLIADGGRSAIKLANSATSGMVLQEGALLDHLNVVDNLKLVSRYAKSPLSDSEISQILAQLNIDKGLHTARISQLSGGQVRRVSIARALITDPDLVLFDEPDAGLDIVNLSSLAATINVLTVEQGKACMTVSHNPFYIAQVANKVYRLQAGKLVLIADWPELPAGVDELQSRQLMLQQQLSVVKDALPVASKEPSAPKKPSAPAKLKRDWPVLSWLTGSAKALASLIHLPKSVKDELSIAGYGIYLSFITGIVFFALVGLMLGSTTIAVVRMLADHSLTGLVGMFVKPETLVNMMGGRYVLYLAPAIGSMLFAARSGSIMSNWLGEMVRGQQVRALNLLGVPSSQYLSAPSMVALFVSMFATVVWFTFCVWWGGILATGQLFDIPHPSAVMSVSQFDLQHSLFWWKALIYSSVVALTVVALGLSPKKTAHQVNIHTTKTIIYSTLTIALAELVIILS